jgi:iron(III) transport system substrate-binding protein
MIDWLAQGKFLLYLFPTANDIEHAKKIGLPVDVIDAPDEESHMSGGFGHVAVLQKAPHPSATKVFVNWLLSKEGQTRWQDKTDNNSLRVDISKKMLSDPTSVPKTTGKYMISSLPQYADVEPVLKIVEEALGKAAKK